MLIQLKNFGPISYFEFDTEKQMHFIFGENNIGKSYAISTVYLILKNICNKNTSIFFRDNYDSFLEDVQKKLMVKNIDKTFNITKEAEKLIFTFFESHYLPFLKQSLINTFDSLEMLKNQFSKKESEIIIHINHAGTFTISLKTNELVLKKLELGFQVIISNGVDETFHSGSYSPQQKIFKVPHRKVHSEQALQQSLLPNMLLGSFNRYLHLPLTVSYFFPASRTGVYNVLNAFGAIFAELSQNRTAIQSGWSIPTIGEPLSDYFLNIARVRKTGTTDDFSEIAQQIERNVLKGKISFNESDKKLYFQPDNTNFSLELSKTSSMISQIAPLVAHLKYIIHHYTAKEGACLVFFEEPEANASPKIQVELMKIFALLAQKGLKIVMTSHSNYLFNKLSNMILAKEIDPATIRVAHMKLGEMGSYVDENSMQVDQDGIDDDNFSETAEALYLERMKLYKQNH